MLAQLPPQVFDQDTDQHDALVGLPGQLGQQLDGLSVVAPREWLEAEANTEVLMYKLRSNGK
ncbi:hypothetical protein M233_08610 [Xylella fastidiosa subsp. multiplex Griffin-1]|nr:hypothetical protein M233_08610 [Xylella fastidiosa subsp. multiplex Griffin-1]OMJ98924.1 hypothetical protein XYFPCFBP8417_08520 [Xylella fastidiosa subsp. multiplex]